MKIAIGGLERQMITYESVIRCPNCHGERREAMPPDACRVLYTCTYCGVCLQPKPGDCCVFCSYGSQPCPPIQWERAGGAQEHRE
ncbi:MAG: hypothetical protein NZM11_01415 [Anaerolineales bacterium]|nr:hypothetical protein [Anaerolineales bacterium]